MTTTMRAASKLFALAGLLVGAAGMTACTGTVDAPSEKTAGAEEALRCAPGTSCDTGGGTPSCDPTTSCCYSGGATMGSSACGSVLYNAGCRGTTTATRANAVELDGSGAWWFEVYCPATAGYVANDPACVSAGIAFNFAGNLCTKSAPPAGKVDVIYDPNCPSGCHYNPGY